MIILHNFIYNQVFEIFTEQKMSDFDYCNTMQETFLFVVLNDNFFKMALAL